METENHNLEPPGLMRSAYRAERARLLHHKRSRSDVQSNAGDENNENNETASNADTENHSGNLTPVRQPMHLNRGIRTPNEGSIVSEPINFYRSRNMGSDPRNTNTEPIMGERLSPPSIVTTPPEGKRKPSWLSFGRRSRKSSESTSPLSSPGTPTPESRRGRRGFENNFYQSIDFSLADSLTVPNLVRAAQAGSVPEVEQILHRGTDIEEQHASTGRNALSVAAHCGNNGVVDLLLQQGARVNHRDASGSTPLHLAASRGHIGSMSLLMLDGADIEEKDGQSRTPLWLAASNGFVEAAELLLSKKAKVNARAHTQLTSLHVAAKRGDTAMIDLLLRHGAHTDARDSQFMTALHYACENGHEAAVNILLNKRADIEAPGTALKTPLICAAAAGERPVVELLLKRKASLKSKAEKGMNALHWASQNGHLEVVELLITKKLPVNISNMDGQSPLHLAVINKKFDVVDFLLRKSAELEARCNRTYTSLHYACAMGSPEIVEILLGHGARLEAPAADDARPLHIAVSQGSLRTVEILLSRGANYEARDKAEDRALCIACVHGHVEIAEALLKAGAPLRSKFSNKPRSYEDSPLCIAARYGHVDLCTLLIKYNASVLQRDERLWQPLRYAAYHGHPEVVQLLLSNGAEVTSTGASSGWGFDITAERIGFSSTEDISQERKDLVLSLLHSAEQLERSSKENDGYYSQTVPPMTQSAASELATPYTAYMKPPTYQPYVSPLASASDIGGTAVTSRPVEVPVNLKAPPIANPPAYTQTSNTSTQNWFKPPPENAVELSSESLDPYQPRDFAQRNREIQAKKDAEAVREYLAKLPPTTLPPLRQNSFPATIGADDFPRTRDEWETEPSQPTDSNTKSDTDSKPPTAFDYSIIAVSPSDISCDSCQKQVGLIHYHCLNCSHGNYDICEACALSGNWCRDKKHILSKRRWLGDSWSTTYETYVPPYSYNTASNNAAETGSTAEKGPHEPTTNGVGVSIKPNQPAQYIPVVSPLPPGQPPSHDTSTQNYTVSPLPSSYYNNISTTTPDFAVSPEPTVHQDTNTQDFVLFAPQPPPQPPPEPPPEPQVSLLSIRSDDEEVLGKGKEKDRMSLVTNLTRQSSRASVGSDWSWKRGDG